MSRYWKFLRTGAVSPFTGFDWSVARGDWVGATGTHACVEGIHACGAGDLAYWLSDELWEIDLEEPVVRSRHKVVAARGRLGARVERWDDQNAHAFSAACLARVVEHAGRELQGAERSAEAEHLQAASAAGIAAAARDVLADLQGGRHRPAIRLCGALVDVAEAADIYPAATIAYMSARAANLRSGPADADYYAEERAWQGRRLVDLLRLDRD